MCCITSSLQVPALDDPDRGDEQPGDDFKEESMEEPKESPEKEGDAKKQKDDDQADEKEDDKEEEKEDEEDESAEKKALMQEEIRLQKVGWEIIFVEPWSHAGKVSPSSLLKAL